MNQTNDAFGPTRILKLLLLLVVPQHSLSSHFHFHMEFRGNTTKFMCWLEFFSAEMFLGSSSNETCLLSGIFMKNIKIKSINTFKALIQIRNQNAYRIIVTMNSFSLIFSSISFLLFKKYRTKKGNDELKFVWNLSPVLVSALLFSK